MLYLLFNEGYSSSAGEDARVLFSWPVEPPYLPLTNDVAEIEPEIVNALARIINLVDEKEELFAPRNIPLSPELLFSSRRDLKAC